MLSKRMQEALNEQIKIEAESSQVYLAMASWAEIQPGIDNVTAFFYMHSDVKHAFEALLKHEIFVSESINKLMEIAFEEKDFATANFLQWYVAEQIEEEALARTMNDKLELIGDDKGGMYLFDKDILTISVVKEE